MFFRIRYIHEHHVSINKMYSQIRCTHEYKHNETYWLQLLQVYDKFLHIFSMEDSRKLRRKSQQTNPNTNNNPYWPNSHAFLDICWGHLLTEVNNKLGKLFHVNDILGIVRVGVDDLGTASNLKWLFTCAENKAVSTHEQLHQLSLGEYLFYLKV